MSIVNEFAACTTSRMSGEGVLVWGGEARERSILRVRLTGDELHSAQEGRNVNEICRRIALRSRAGNTRA